MTDDPIAKSTASPQHRARSRVPLCVPLAARSPTDPHRAATQLELLFDLTFVGAVASATLPFAHRVAEGDASGGLAPFLQVVFAIWWAWMNFTWFASAYDNGDATYRLLVIAQMAGVLVLALGIPSATDGDLRGVTIGYLMMRIGLVALWLRVAHDCPASRLTALRYVAGITLLEVAWVARLLVAERRLLPEPWLLPVFVVLVVAELGVPWWAEHASRSDSTTWHPHHIVERYGLFGIILLGEALVALSAGTRSALAADVGELRLTCFAGAAFVLTMALWWLYFLDSPVPGLVAHRQRAFWWGYAHFAIFVSMAAFAAGVDVVALHLAGHAQASPTAVGYAVAIPVAAFLLALRAVNAAVVTVPSISTRAAATTAVVVLAVPLAARAFGPVSVVGAIAAACTALIGSTSIERRALAVVADAGDRPGG